MADWNGKSKGTVWGYKFLLFILKIVGPTPVYIILYPVVFYYFFFSGTFKSTFWYFRNVHHFSIIKSIIGVYRNYYSLAVSIVDKAAIFGTDNHGIEITFEGEENLSEFNKNVESGGILLSAHMGSWEMAAHKLNKYNRNINIVIVDAEHLQIKKVLETYMSKIKKNKNIKRIPIVANNFDHVFKIQEALKKNELVSINADRFIDTNKIVSKLFAGKMADFPVGPFQLSALYQTPISMVFGFKVSIKKYKLYGIKHISPHFNETKNEYSERAMNYYIENLEYMLKKYPYQWFNFYYFWNTNKNGN
jgi:predicted LPLAT superfamily acyltransferase